MAGAAREPKFDSDWTTSEFMAERKIGSAVASFVLFTSGTRQSNNVILQKTCVLCTHVGVEIVRRA